MAIQARQPLLGLAARELQGLHGAAIQTGILGAVAPQILVVES
jgi:hypothetical protein